MTMFQFIRSGVGFGDGGKKEKTKAMAKNIIDTILINKPHLPKENLLGSRGLSTRRRQVTQPILHM